MAVQTEHEVVKSELKWAAVAGVTVGIIFAAILGAALAFQMNPPSNIEMIDPKTLHLSGEFTEGNLGTSITPQGQVVARVIATQFAFLPRCIVVPRDQPVTLRFATPGRDPWPSGDRHQRQHDGRAGLCRAGAHDFTRTGDLLMPCHEFCGLGHSQMWATVRVVEPNAVPARTRKGGCPVRSLERLTSRISGWPSRPSRACVLGVWQMWVRSPLSAPFSTPDHYFLSVTAHGVSMAYVLTTFFIMGFGYFVAVTALNRPLPGTALGLGRVLHGRSPARSWRPSRSCWTRPRCSTPSIRRSPASPFFYVGLVLVVVGLVDLVRADDRRHGAVEARQPGPPGAAGHVRDGRQRHDVALDDGWRRRGTPVPGYPRFARPGRRPSMWASRARCFHGRCTRSSISGCSRPISRSTPWRRRRRAAGSTATRWAGSPSSFSCSIQPAGRHASSVHGSGARDGLQVHADAASPRSCRCRRCSPSSPSRLRWRSPAGCAAAGAVRLDRRVAVGAPDGARDGACLRHARLRRLRRAHQHELRHERDGAQHLLGHGAFPPDLRRLGRDHVFRHRLRDLAAPHRARPRGRCGSSGCSSGSGSSA